MSLCGVALAHGQRPLHLARDLLGDFEKWLTPRMSNEMDPASAILVFSALISLEQLAALGGTMELPSHAWGHLHHFFNLVRAGTGICGQRVTYWHMGYAILRVAHQAKFGFMHPIFREAPPRSIWSGLYMEYWRGRVVKKRSYQDMLEEFHNHLLNGLKEVLGEEAEVNCGGCCGVPAQQISSLLC